MAFNEKSSNEDVIGCHFKRFNIEEANYGVCEFFRNGIRVGKELIAEARLYPCIWVASGRAILEANLGDKEFSYMKGTL